MRKALAAVLALLPSIAMAQTFPQTLPSHTVVGRINAGTGPAEAIPFSTLGPLLGSGGGNANDILSGLCTTAGAFPIYNAASAAWACSTAGAAGSAATLNGGPLLIDTGIGSRQGLTIKSAPSGSAVTPNCPGGVGEGTDVCLNYINLANGADEGIGIAGAIGNSFVDAFVINHYFGGPDAVGGRQTLLVNSVLEQPTKSTNINKTYAGTQINMRATANDGGTDGANQGRIYGLGVLAGLYNTATYYTVLSGIEIDIFAAPNPAAGTYGPDYKTGVNIVLAGGDTVQGRLYDAMLMLSGPATGSVPGWKNGIQFSDMNGGAALAPTGTMISSFGPATVANGIDFSSYTITGDAIKMPNYHLTGAGNLVVGSNTLAPVGNLTVHAAANINFFVANNNVGGISLGTINDANSVFGSLFLRASLIQFGGTTLGAGSSHLATYQGTATAIGTCGTSPAVAGTDTAGQITTGSTATTACTVTFAAGYTTAPYCVATPVGAANAGLQIVTTTSTMVLTYTSGTSLKFNYFCMQLGVG